MVPILVGAGIVFSPNPNIDYQDTMRVIRYFQQDLTPEIRDFIIVMETSNDEINETKEDKEDIKLIEQEIYEIPDYPGMKKFMSYELFSSNTNQAKLQKKAFTDSNGLRRVDDRYCVAMGTHFNMEIGQCFDLILKNGTEIPCVLADIKNPKHTDSQNIFSNMNKNLCASEFVISPPDLKEDVKKRGDISFIKIKWQSPVKYVRVYKNNILKE